MDYRQLGRSGLRVSQVCLGTMNFGNVNTSEESHDILDHALDNGINFFDTANIYGGSDRGSTERIIGDWFARGDGRRDRTVIATKVYGDMGTWPNEGKLSALNIRRSCDASLARLKTDHIDLYQMHHIDRATSWEEIWEAMDLLRQQGKVLYFGSSNFAGWHIAQGQEAARRRGMLGLVSEQSIYNLTERTVELEVLPAAQAYGLGLIPYAPLHGGLLGGVLRRRAAGDTRRSDSGRAAAAFEKQLVAVEAWESFCAELGLSPATAALAWLMNRPGVTAPIVGPRSRDQLDDAIYAVDIKLDVESLARIDQIFPGPGGTAPEAYAW